MTQSNFEKPNTAYRCVCFFFKDAQHDSLMVSVFAIDALAKLGLLDLALILLNLSILLNPPHRMFSHPPAFPFFFFFRRAPLVLNLRFLVIFLLKLKNVLL